MSIQELRNRFAEAGFSKDQIDKIMKICVDGVPIKISPHDFKMEMNPKANIRFISRKGDDPGHGDFLFTHLFIAEIEGIPAEQIRSVTIPKLDYSDPGLLTLDVEIMPFRVPKL